MSSDQPKSAWFGQKAISSLRGIWNVRSKQSHHKLSPLPETSIERLTSPKEKTILYLAYGSNLARETFQGTRGVKPLSSVNVHAPTLALTFDLPGIPYLEPCFANTRYRDPSSDPPSESPGYHKDRWHKGLVGVVYEITPEDYRTIIATEGGGAGYQQVVVPCYALAKDDIVAPIPSGTPFKAHTLLQPRDHSEMDAGEIEVKNTSRPIQRQDPSYAQPSARYLKLLTDGGEEHSLPSEYLAYLYNIRPYTITTFRQRIGRTIFLTSWIPIVMTFMGLGKILADKKGKMPTWMVPIMGALFKGLWGSYDVFFKRPFGDGERTMNEQKDEGRWLEEASPEWLDEKTRQAAIVI
ncbi:Uncharacterized protein BP5553_00042 [Venustampulla echinocandica]|uniref:gamma-glutamylcyclotransferase n=1 Tax=Venustampulla echinocandica TaxID=2656787 RepID=A0A370TX15_9HELO|nr:Uncharacterized protein BP5553_00042 [Venustampulla echinocandica]RDL40063.1 Uncharacterized protein BP5553_00042 [Venustampulla echinocandica]